MRQLQQVELDQHAMGLLVQLTGAFEGIASMRIAGIKNQVVQATQFFQELWRIYTQLRVDSQFRFGRSQASAKELVDKDLFIIITAEGGFSGDIDQKLIEMMRRDYDPNQHDIIVIGHHGAIQLAQQGISYIKYFKMPVQDRNLNVTPVVNEVQRYKSTTVFYQEYVSLLVQDVKKIELESAVKQAGKVAERPDEVISEQTYIFEPSTYAVVDHLEQSMLHIAVSQLILDSKLAQYASRFRAMSASSKKAHDASDELKLLYNRTNRNIKDERIKEVVNSLRASGETI